MSDAIFDGKIYKHQLQSRTLVQYCMYTVPQNYATGLMVAVVCFHMDMQCYFGAMGSSTEVAIVPSFFFGRHPWLDPDDFLSQHGLV